MTLAEGLLVDADVGDRLRHLAGLPADHGTRHDPPPLIPRDPRNPTRPDHRAAMLDQINDQLLHQQREAAPRLRPGHRHLLHAVRGTVDARHPGVENRLVLAGIEMPPHPCLRVIATRQRLQALWTRPPDVVGVLGPQVDALATRQAEQLHAEVTAQAPVRRTMIEAIRPSTSTGAVGLYTVVGRSMPSGHSFGHSRPDSAQQLLRDTQNP